jgi:hypothetical protein
MGRADFGKLVERHMQATGLSQGRLEEGETMMTLAEHEAWLADQDDPATLRAEALERMNVNVGLVADNLALRRRIWQLEEGR